jgi:PTH1 family peptidyl-tRNA hydrolase
VQEQSKELVIVGLGNPGKKYQLTRHNIGERVIRALAETLQLRFKEEGRFEAEIARGTYKGCKVSLIFPHTYMNESGRALKRYLDYHKLTSNEVVVVCDDSDLPFGVFRLRTQGSSGGHNGLKSIESYLNTRAYIRLRMGIGAKGLDQDLAEHVLGKIAPEEMNRMRSFIEDGVKWLLRLVCEDVHLLMNDVNRIIKQSNKDLLRGGEENCHEPKQTKPL